MAMTADKSKESSVVTRTFIVREIEKDKDTDVSWYMYKIAIFA